MSKRLKNNIGLIYFLTDINAPLQLNSVLRTLSKDQVDTISEIAANILYGNIPISDKYKNILKRYKSKIEYIGNAKNSATKRKALVTKSYKLIKILLQAAKPLLKSLI